MKRRRNSSPRPFQYSRQKLSRRHHPTGYVNYRSYKPWLRDEFEFRCVYCLSRETWYPSGADAFSADHVEPQARRPDLETEYTNLVYACVRCNSIKSDSRQLPDPTARAFGRLLEVDAKGRISGKSKAGRLLIELLHLDSPAATRCRREQLLVLAAKRKHPEDPEVDAIFRLRFGYPADMYDLRRLKGRVKNLKANSEDGCHVARQERAELADVY